MIAVQLPPAQCWSLSIHASPLIFGLQTSTVFSGTAMGATMFELAFTSGYSTSDSDSAADDFSLRTTQGRLVYICCKLLSLEEQWGDSG